MEIRFTDQMEEKALRTGSTIKVSDLAIIWVEHHSMEIATVKNHCIIKFPPGLRRDFMEGEAEKSLGLMDPHCAGMLQPRPPTSSPPPPCVNHLFLSS